MAVLVNRDQRITTGVLYPRGVYSRVAGALAVVKAPDVRAFGYTAALGNRLWLLKVRVWFLPVWPNGTAWVDFWVRFGTGKPGDYASMSNWTDLLPINWLGSGPLGYRELGTGRVFEWTMNRPIVGDAIRFGIQVECAPEIIYEEMYATFEISEG